MNRKQLETNNNPAVVPMEHDKRILSRLQLFRNVDLDHPVFDDLLMQVQLPKITVSIGVAEYRPGYTLETLVAAAIA